jgi:hypothetical protein
MSCLAEDVAPSLGPLNHNTPFVPSIGWDYLSGFFDGEGSINIDIKPGSKTLTLRASIVQKNKPLLELIAEFLASYGIRSRILVNSRLIHELKVSRVDDLRKFLMRLNLVLKRLQALTVIAYLEGEIVGNELLKNFDYDYKAGRRRSTPLRSGLDYPLTRVEAAQAAQEIRVNAARSAQKTKKLARLRERAAMLPSQFEVQDLAGALRYPSTNARYLIHEMIANGLVSCKLVGMGRGGARLVCTKSWVD